MNGIQYTIRAIPIKLDKTLRAQAKQSGKSLNEVVLQSLAKGAGVDMGTSAFHDCDWFAGSLEPDVDFDKALKWLDSLPKELE